MKQLWRSHRTFGYEVARASQDGTELVILKTAPHKLDVSPAHMLLPVTEQELALEVRMALMAAIEHGLFLGYDADMLRQAFEKALESTAQPSS